MDTIYLKFDHEYRHKVRLEQFCKLMDSKKKPLLLLFFLNEEPSKVCI